MRRNRLLHLSVVVPLALISGCGDSGGGSAAVTAQSCMTCHNGSGDDDYGGPGLENPHPFATAANLQCTACHGGNGNGDEKVDSHVPPPPEIGNKQNLVDDAHAYFNRLTLAGIDKFPDYQVGGQTYTSLDYLQFINPGDLRVVSQGRGCGQCHDDHSEFMARNVLATETGFFSGSQYLLGVENAVPANQGLYLDTAADLAFRAQTDPGFASATPEVGIVSEVIEVPVYSVHGKKAPDQLYQNFQITAASLANDQLPNNQVVTDSHLAHLFIEQVSFTCGDCHLGSAGANNRAGDFRSSGCTACHMPYSLGGRSGSNDPNIKKNEPLDPDDIDAPERAHVRQHRIRSVSKTLPGGVKVKGIDDHTCAGCHQGSNRTVMQYWGIRLDQNADVVNGDQYPANPVKFKTTHNDKRLFDPVVGNHTFNGRNGNQYLVFEDYDNDGRDDTPADVHYEAGMGCIDCHGGYDLHGGDVTDPAGPRIRSRMEQVVGIRCVDCHGTIDAYAPTAQGIAWNGQAADLAMDSKGRPLDHVMREADGNVYLYSRLTGKRHFVRQTRDVIADNGKLDPFTQQPVYNAKASYSMGRADADPSNGIGSQQTGGALNGFSHTDDMTCQVCHASWTNTCMGCHLKGKYDTGNNFSNITGERIVYEQANADFVYQSPLYFQLGVGADNKIGNISANTKVFYQYRDINGDFSKIFSFTDRSGGGNNPSAGTPSLSHNVLMAHSIRGKVETKNEGPRYCVACHLTEDGLANWGAEYDAFRTALASRNYGALDYQLLKTHFGKNPGNQLDSPLWVNMVAGLGTGLFAFDKDGAAVNPLDTNPNRIGSNGVAPASIWDPANITRDLDRIVEASGVSNGSNGHMLFNPGQGPNLRDGSLDPDKCGPLGTTLIQALTDPANGIVLNAWIDADGQLRGDAPNFVP